MGILMYSSLIFSLSARKHQLEYQKIKISRKIQDLQKYTSIVGKQNITISDLLSCPAELRERAFYYVNYSNAFANQYTQQNAPIYQMLYNQNGAMADPNQQQMMNNYIINALIKQGKEEASKVEQANLHEIEGMLRAEKEKIDVQYDFIKEELEAAKKARDSEIKEWAPKYA